MTVLPKATARSQAWSFAVLEIPAMFLPREGLGEFVVGPGNRAQLRQDKDHSPYCNGLGPVSLLCGHFVSR